MGKADYKPNSAGFKACAVGPEVAAATLAVAEKAKASAVDLSEGFRKTGDYIDAFEVRSETVMLETGFGAHPVAAGILENKAPYASGVEWGNKHDHKPHRVLGRVLTELSERDDLSPFSDIEAAVMELLGDLASTGTLTPPDLAGSLPFLRIRRLGGGEDRLVNSPHVDVEAFASTREAAYSLAESCRQRLLNVPHVTAAGVIDSVDSNGGPQEVSWEDPLILRYVATYCLTAGR
jgi:hypothetical protein